MRPVTRQRGFTLVEMAIALLVLGLLIAGAVTPYKLYLTRTAMQTTQNNVAELTSAIGNFRLLNGYYPCAASLTLPSSDPNYGHQSTDCVTRTLGPGNCVGGMVAGGICIQSSGRNVTYAPQTVPPTAPLGGPPHVAVGAVPFRELNIDESQTFDGYNNRLFYVVTEPEADPTYFQPDGGGIGVLNDQNVSALGAAANSADSAHFLVFSAGKDGAGAFSRDGQLHAACPVAEAEGINCSLGALARYRSAQTSTASGAKYYDDVMSYFTTADLPLWQYPPGNTTDIQDKPGGNVGTAATSQQSVDYKTQVRGVANISASLMSQDLCGSTGVDCFKTSLITGDPAHSGGLTCPNLHYPYPYLMAIVDGQAQCTNEVYAECKINPATRKQQVMNGIQADGTPICADYSAPPPNCPSLTDTLCVANDVHLNSSPIGTVAPVSAGTSRHVSYTCTGNGTTSSWVKGAATGSCTCTPSVVVSAQACGTGFTGVKTVTTATICPAGTVTVTVDASLCTCVGATKNNTANCPPPLTGTYLQTSTLTCPAGTFGPFLPSTPPAGVCTCNPATQTITNNCPGNLTGTWQQTRNLVCPAGTYTAYLPSSPPNGACTCDPNKTLTGTDACPPATPVGSGIPWTETLSCPSGTWGPKVYGTPDCQIAPPVICHWNNTSGGNTSGTPRGPGVGATCACGATGRCSSQLGTNSYENYNGCVCQ